MSREVALLARLGGRSGGVDSVISSPDCGWNDNSVAIYFEHRYSSTIKDESRSGLRRLEVFHGPLSSFA